VAFFVLFYGFKTLPPPEYIYQFHPEYEQYGANYADKVYDPDYINEKKVLDIQFGSNLLFLFFEKFVADPDRIPNPHELMHYPILMAGFIALFFTSLNLLPIGQLDGGHVIYGLFGRNGHRVIATTFFILLLLYSGLGYADIRTDRDQLTWLIPSGILFYYICLQGLGLPWKDTLMYALLMVVFLMAMAWYFPHIKGYSGWLFFGLLVGRFMGVHHPPTEIEEPLSPNRQLLGWLCLLIFILCFSPQPLILNEIDIPK
jgi:membrane-associated protease RseP (regulator of RpoE activity)